MQILVTGGMGMLGREFARMAGLLPYVAVTTLSRESLDVRNAEAVRRVITDLQPDWIAHCAALVDVEGCAKDPEAARATIVDGTRNVAQAAHDVGSRLLYPQSFLVYDGATTPISETEMPRPLSLYGQLKYEAERLLADEIEQPLIIRMAGFFGGEDADKNFVGRIIPHMHAAIRRGERQFAVGDRVWQPTWTRDLAENSLHLMAAGKSGTWQMASHGQASFAEIAEQIVVALDWGDRLRIETVPAVNVAGNELGRRPDIAVLSCARLRGEAMDLQRDWRSALHAYMRHPFFDRYRFKGT